jgi:hypothetical protein
MKLLLMIVFLVVLLVLGSWCLFYPRVIQAAAARAVQQGLTSRLTFLRNYIESPQYLYVVMTVGIGSYLMVALLCLALYRARLGP